MVDGFRPSSRPSPFQGEGDTCPLPRRERARVRVNVDRLSHQSGAGGGEENTNQPCRHGGGAKAIVRRHCHDFFLEDLRVLLLLLFTPRPRREERPGDFFGDSVSTIGSATSGADSGSFGFLKIMRQPA